ncbi:MAG: exopolysaccharide biosynthesis protein [Eubacterium sp.]|nr:exopolysaccharide biosynthesis protein [Eubacterium sp.]
MILSFIIFYVGQFLFFKKDIPAAAIDAASKYANSHISQPDTVKKPFPVDYKHVSITINGQKQEIFTLEFAPSDERVEFKPVHAYDSVFGFEKISEISKRTGAYAAINGGFFYEYGDPVGMLAIDGRLYMAATGHDPVLVVDKYGARFEKLVSDIFFMYKDKKVNINQINRTGDNKDIILYTNDFGSTNRAEENNTSIRIVNNVVTAVYQNVTQLPLIKDSDLVSFFGSNASLPGKLGIKEGDTVNIEIKPDLGNAYQAYSCGSMLVDEGKVVAPETDRWAGTLLNRDPRTAIGIKADGRLVLIVVDGRQPGYSAGLTGEELAEYLVELGVREAAMLDGGATSQIFVDGSLKNRPSYRGMERPVAGAFIVKVKDT